MKRALLTLGAVVTLSSTANAGWSAPHTFSRGHATAATAAVAPNGATVATWHTRTGIVFARVDRGRPIPITTSYEAATVATHDGAFVGWTAAPDRAVVARAMPGGLLGEPETVGGGALQGLVANDKGDLAALTASKPSDTGVNETAFRPAGGTFGPPAALPTTPLSYGFTVTPLGETLASSTHLDPATGEIRFGFDVSDRLRNGQVTTTTLDPTNSSSGQTNAAALAGDGRGRVLAVWPLSFRNGLLTAVRTRDGRWSAPVEHAVTESFQEYTIAVTPDGHAVIAYREGPTTLRYVTGTTASATFGAPRTLDTTTAAPHLRALPDNGFAIAYRDGPTLRVSRARPGHAFAAPEDAACLNGTNTFDIAGILQNGRLVLRAGTALVRETRGHRTAHC
ncbi:MAG: hypothetical protein QOF76_4116 [Solirubrobacteraceae bacterium]|jgi:hypothetical protein|nr:hypothetical protein [Solirubrobacteraceae bacterium]